MMTSHCTLRRCQGKRGCLCPKGKNLPTGVYAAPKLVQLDAAVDSSNQGGNVLQNDQKIENLSGAGHNTKNGTSLFLPAIGSKNGSKKVVAGADNTGKTSSPTKLASIAKSNAPTPSKPAVSGTIPDTQIVSIPQARPTDSTVVEVLTPVNGNGQVTIRFNHYKKLFPIENGVLTAAAIDAEYYITFAYPDCKIHLSTYGASDFSYEELGLTSAPLIQENTPGTFLGLEADRIYFVVVEEDTKNKEEYEKRQAELVAANAVKRKQQEEAEDSGLTIVKSKMESCSCIEGNPCIDAYCCKDFPNRYEVAKRNGWKGFQ